MILDLLLPGLDGLEVLSELQRLRPGLPVLILSARTDIATKLRGFELGAVDYLDKPFSLDELLARARVQLRRSHGAGGHDPARRRPGAGSDPPPGPARRTSWLTCPTASSGCCTS